MWECSLVLCARWLVCSQSLYPFPSLLATSPCSTRTLKWVPLNLFLFLAFNHGIRGVINKNCPIHGDLLQTIMAQALCSNIWWHAAHKRDIIIFVDNTLLTSAMYKAYSLMIIIYGTCFIEYQARMFNRKDNFLYRTFAAVIRSFMAVRSSNKNVLELSEMNFKPIFYTQTTVWMIHMRN